MATIPEKRTKTLNEMMIEVKDVNVEKGWFDQKSSFGERIALLHSEASEMLEAYRMWKLRDATGGGEWDNAGKHLPSEICDCVNLKEAGRPFHCADLVHIPGKPEGVGSEAADVLIRLLDLAYRYDIDLEFEYERKLAYNKTRGYQHGGKTL